MEPGSGATVVYGGTDNRNMNGAGRLFKYDPSVGSPEIIDDVSGEASIRSLVTTRGESLYGGTGDKGHFFSYKPGGSINDFGAIIADDSVISALIIGCAAHDSDWIYGATSQAHFTPPDSGPSQGNGGNIFVYESDSLRIVNRRRPVGSQRNIPCLTNFVVAGTSDHGYMCGGTGPDSTYIFVECYLGFCDMAHPDTCGPVQSGGSIQRILGICRVSDDSIFGVTCDVPDTDSAMVFYYRWPEPDTNTWLRVRKLDEGEYRAGPMVVGRDGLIYFSSIYGIAQGGTPRFYQWNWRSGTWSPGDAESGDYNPRYWTYSDTIGASEIKRFRSFAVDSSDDGLIYIGTGSDFNTHQAHLLVFDPTLAAGQLKLGAGMATRKEGLSRRLVLIARPNPFSHKTELGYDAVDPPSPKEPALYLTIYDMAGARVRTLIEGQTASANGILTWDGRNDSGTAVGAGVYFCRLTSGDASCTRKLVFLK